MTEGVFSELPAERHWSSVEEGGEIDEAELVVDHLCAEPLDLLPGVAGALQAAAPLTVELGDPRRW